MFKPVLPLEVLVCLASLGLGACAGTVSGTVDAGTTTDGGLDGGSSASDSGTSGNTDGGGSGTDGGDPGWSGSLPATWTGSTFVAGAHDAPQDVVIEPGATMTVQAGASLTFAPGARLIVHGALVVAGASGNLATLNLEPGQGRWGGIVVEQSGTAQMGSVHISGAGAVPNAGLSVAASAGVVTLTDSTFDNCFPALRFNAGATVQRVVVHNSSPPIDGPIIIQAGSPTLTDILVDQGNSGVDAIIVNAGGPQISHVTIKNHHCCIHAGQSSGLTVDAMECDTSNIYGFMFYSSAGASGTGSNITCGASASAYYSNTAIDLRGNYWGGGTATVAGGDSSLVDASNFATQPLDAGMR